MPLGVIVNVVAVCIGGGCGLLIKDKMGEDFKKQLNRVFALCSMGMGIASIVLMRNMPAVVFALIVGTACGLFLHLGEQIQKGAGKMQKIAARLLNGQKQNDPQEGSIEMLVTVIVLFCASGTGIYGSIVSGMTGDHSILIAKSVLDFFTAMIFACSLGGVIALIAIPQFCIFTLLFACAGLVYPMTTPVMIDDFKAVGGFIMLATGFRMIQLEKFPTADMIPAMVLVFPFSWAWTTFLLPLIGG